jgi:elongation factor P--beta-lysine ligase
MVSKSTFKTFAMDNREGNYFLRRDRVLGAFQVDRFKSPDVSMDQLVELDLEKSRDRSALDKMEKADMKRITNTFRIDMEIESIWGSLVRGSVNNRISTNHAPPQPLSLLSSLPSRARALTQTRNRKATRTSYTETTEGSIELGNIFSKQNDMSSHSTNRMSMEKKQYVDMPEDDDDDVEAGSNSSGQSTLRLNPLMRRPSDLDNDQEEGGVEI